MVDFLYHKNVFLFKIFFCHFPILLDFRMINNNHLIWFLSSFSSTSSNTVHQGTSGFLQSCPAAGSSCVALALEEVGAKGETLRSESLINLLKIPSEGSYCICLLCPPRLKYTSERFSYWRIFRKKQNKTRQCYSSSPKIQWTVHPINYEQQNFVLDQASLGTWWYAGQGLWSKKPRVKFFPSDRHEPQKFTSRSEVQGCCHDLQLLPMITLNH